MTVLFVYHVNMQLGNEKGIYLPENTLNELHVDAFDQDFTELPKLLKSVQEVRPASHMHYHIVTSVYASAAKLEGTSHGLVKRLIEHVPDGKTYFSETPFGLANIVYDFSPNKVDQVLSTLELKKNYQLLLDATR